MYNKTRLKQDIWRGEKYYKLAKKGSLDINHPGMRVLLRLSENSKNILDLGCGEGTRLNSLLHKGQRAVGVDISSKALDMGKKNYPAINFIKADLENIPLKSDIFDLVYSAFVLEHLKNPLKVLNEAMRLISSGGGLVLIAPNYGAPNRVSPPFRGSRIKKLVRGLLNDLINLIMKRGIKWGRVEPIVNKDNYHTDWDTVIEPYLGSLVNYFKYLGFRIDYYSSCWSEELADAGKLQRFIRLLGELKIYPFNLWGPHLVLVVRKS